MGKSNKDLWVKPMLKIGDFAKLSGITIKALRYYDTRGLLHPIHIDPFTSYRYYSVEQLPRLNRILSLKDLGFSIEQIHMLLQHDLPLDNLRSMLRAQQVSTQEQIRQQERRLARVEARLKQIEHEDILLHSDIVVKETPSQTVICMREIVPTSKEIDACCLQLVHKIVAQCQSEGISCDGTWMTLYYGGPYTGDDHNIDLEMALVIDRTLLNRPCVGNISNVRELAMGTVASLVHTGDYAQLWQAYFSIMDWADTNGYNTSGLYRQILLQGPYEGIPVTEAQLAISKIK